MVGGRSTYDWMLLQGHHAHETLTKNDDDTTTERSGISRITHGGSRPSLVSSSARCSVSASNNNSSQWTQEVAQRHFILSFCLQRRSSVRTASRCRRAYILPLCFFFFFSTPNLWGHWTDLNQTWTHIHSWLLFEKFGPNSPGHLPHGLGKTAFWGQTLNFDRIYLCNGTKHQHSERNLSICRHSPTCPQIWWTLVHPLNFSIGRHCQPYRMDVI